MDIHITREKQITDWCIRPNPQIGIKAASLGTKQVVFEPGVDERSLNHVVCFFHWVT